MIIMSSNSAPDDIYASCVHLRHEQRPNFICHRKTKWNFCYTRSRKVERSRDDPSVSKGLSSRCGRTAGRSAAFSGNHHQPVGRAPESLLFGINGGEEASSQRKQRHSFRNSRPGASNRGAKPNLN